MIQNPVAATVMRLTVSMGSNAGLIQTESSLLRRAVRLDGWLR
jgi:hypothetical protein